jgi:hypothetical protein
VAIGLGLGNGRESGRFQDFGVASRRRRDDLKRNSQIGKEIMQRSTNARNDVIPLACIILPK